MYLIIIPQVLATQGAFILVGYKLAFSQAVPALYPLDNPFGPMTALWLSNVRLFFPVMIWSIVSGCVLIWYFKDTSRILYAVATASLLGAGLVTKFAMLPAAEAIMQGPATGSETLALMKTCVSRNWLRTALCLAAGVLSLSATLLQQ